MIERYLNIKIIIKELFGDSHEGRIVSDSEVCMMEELLPVLKPLKDAMKVI